MADDLFDPRLTEQRNPRTRDIDLAGPLEIVDLINAEDRTVPDAVRAERQAIARAIEMAVECFKRGGRLIYVGAGTSGRLGVLDAAECPPTFGSDPEMVRGIIAGGDAALVRSQEGAEDRAEEGAAAMDEAAVGSADFVFGIATSSTTPYVRAALKRAGERGARTGFLCCTEPGAELRGAVDVCIVPLVGPEAIAGSTRMKAGTATKLVLNTLTTGAMIRLGKVYGNLMVDVRALSDKLVDRSRRIVMAAAGCTRERAERALGAAGGSAKLAIVMERAAVGPQLAALCLVDSDGFVRRALELAESAAHSLAGDRDPYHIFPAAPPSGAALELIRALVGGLPQQVAELVAGAPDDRLRARPAEGKWCAKEHIEHLIMIDEMMAKRIAAIVTRDDPEIANWDETRENRKAAERGAREASIEALLRRLSSSRAALVQPVEAVLAEALARTGRHELYGPISAYQILRSLVAHDHHHAEALRRLVAG
jgi:N-acetylmuramic acid 6-phosphate etherase